MELTLRLGKRSSPTLERFVEDTYLPALSVRLPTQEDYVRTLRQMVLPYLGAMALSDIEPHTIEIWLGTLKRRGASEQVRAHAFRILRACLKRAVVWRVMESCPTDGVRPPRPMRRDFTTLTTEEANAYLDAFEEHPVELAVVLALAAGLRLSEIAALSWADIDFAKKVVRVRKAVRHVAGGVVMLQPKSPRSRRDVSLPEWALERLSAYAGSGPIFGVQPGAITSAYRKHVRNCRLRPIAFRDLRHTHATLLLAAGANVVTVSRRLGHQSVSTTDMFYLQPGRAADRDAARKAEVIRRSTRRLGKRTVTVK